jgi:hypothetical protein
VSWIIGDPRVSLNRPQNQTELEETVESIRNVINEMDLTEYGDIEDHAKIRDTLVGMLTTDIGMESISQPSDSQTANAQFAQAEVSKDQTSIGAEDIAPPSEDEPPAKLTPFIDKFVEKINDNESEFDYSDFLVMVQWVTHQADVGPEK